MTSKMFHIPQSKGCALFLKPNNTALQKQESIKSQDFKIQKRAANTQMSQTIGDKLFTTEFGMHCRILTGLDV